jgi:hypothetical protein
VHPIEVIRSHHDHGIPAMQSYALRTMLLCPSHKLAETGLRVLKTPPVSTRTCPYTAGGGAFV